MFLGLNDPFVEFGKILVENESDDKWPKPGADQELYLDGSTNNFFIVF